MKTVKALGWTLVILGVWEALAPMVLGFGMGKVLAQAIVVGALWAVFGLWMTLYAYRDTVAWLGWLSVLVGLWLVIAPAAMGYASVPAAMWNDVVIGFVGMAVSVWAACHASGLPMPPAPQGHVHH